MSSTLALDLDSINRRGLAAKLGWELHSIGFMFNGKRDARVTEVYLMAKALDIKPIEMFEALLLARARQYKKKNIQGSIRGNWQPIRDCPSSSE